MNMLNKVNCCLLCECVANAQALINTMWLNMTQQFGLRGRHEHVQMLWGDVDMKTDPAGRTYLEFNERCTKTRNGTSRDVRRFSPKMFATGKTKTGDMHSICFCTLSEYVRTMDKHDYYF